MVCSQEGWTHLIPIGTCPLLRENPGGLELELVLHWALQSWPEAGGSWGEEGGDIEAEKRTYISEKIPCVLGSSGWQKQMWSEEERQGSAGENL